MELLKPFLLISDIPVDSDIDVHFGSAKHGDGKPTYKPDSSALATKPEIPKKDSKKKHTFGETKSQSKLGPFASFLPAPNVAKADKKGRRKSKKSKSSKKSQAAIDALLDDLGYDSDSRD